MPSRPQLLIRLFCMRCDCVCPARSGLSLSLSLSLLFYLSCGDQGFFLVDVLSIGVPFDLMRTGADDTEENKVRVAAKIGSIGSINRNTSKHDLRRGGRPWTHCRHLWQSAGMLDRESSCIVPPALCWGLLGLDFLRGGCLSLLVCVFGMNTDVSLSGP